MGICLIFFCYDIAEITIIDQSDIPLLREYAFLFLILCIYTRDGLSGTHFIFGTASATL